MKNQIPRILAAVATAISLFFAFSFSQSGFETIQNFKQLERIVPSKLVGVLNGEVQVTGSASFLSTNNSIDSPKARVKSIYYRYLEEREERDSDGNTRWVTVRDESDAVDFLLTDETGVASVYPEDMVSEIAWSMPSSYRSRSGSRRFTEWRIEPGDTVTLFGLATLGEIQTEYEEEPPEIDIYFVGDGSFLPIVTKYDATTVRGSLGLEAIIKIWGGISLLALSVFFFLYFLQIHRIIAFLSLVTAFTSLYLFSYGFASLNTNLKTGFDYVNNKSLEAQKTVQELNTLGSEAWVIERLKEVSINQAYIESIYHQQISTFPENLVALLTSRKLEERIDINAEQEATLNQRLNAFNQTQISNEYGNWWVILTFLLFAALSYFGFKFARTKRVIENVPTSKTKGVCFGLTEIKGRIRAIDDQTLQSPLTNTKSVWFRYKIEEKRGSGKKSKWVTISDKTQSINFNCEDSTGVLAIAPSGADIITSRKKVERSGRMRYTEWVLKVNDKLYAIGSAEVNKAHGNALVLERDEGEDLFILSNLSEEEIMLRKAAKSMVSLLLAFSAMFFSAVFFHGLSGDFSATDYLASGLIAPVFLLLFILIMHYNDLIFLKRRADRNWANIQVSLKKRKTLLPRLESVVKKYLEHEQTLLTEISDLRTTAESSLDRIDAAGKYIGHESKVLDELRVAVEAYPDLKADKLMQSFSESLVSLEDEVALMREGFNDAVMQYNARIESFPDLYLARIAKFKRISLLDFEATSVPTTVLK